LDDWGSTKMQAFYPAYFEWDFGRPEQPPARRRSRSSERRILPLRVEAGVFAEPAHPPV